MASARYFRTGLAVTALALLAGCADQPVASFESPKYLAEAAQAQTDVYFKPGARVSRQARSSGCAPC